MIQSVIGSIADGNEEIRVNLLSFLNLFRFKYVIELMNILNSIIHI